MEIVNDVSSTLKSEEIEKVKKNNFFRHSVSKFSNLEAIIKQLTALAMP